MCNRPKDCYVVENMLENRIDRGDVVGDGFLLHHRIAPPLFQHSIAISSLSITM